MSDAKKLIIDAIDKMEDIECLLEEDVIFSVDNFKRELDRAGLMTEELDNFIDNCMRWDND